MARALVVLLVLTAVVLALPVTADDDPVATLKARLVKDVDAHAKASAKLKKFVKEKLLPLTTNETFVKETVAQNAKRAPLAEIKKIDKAWIEAEDELPIHVEKTTNSCAKAIKRVIAVNSVLVEVFVMDDQGAVVGENQLTSDYWQGDEAKWTGSYASGNGGVDVGKAKFDRSANANLQQVSLPVIDAEGKVVGAVTFGVNVDKL
jgi:predicted metallopeptidase